MRRRALALGLALVACSKPPSGPVGFAVVGAQGSADPMCLWLADTAGLQEHGLMDVTSLGKAKGMVFRFDAPTRTAFYMYRTQIPLTVVFVDASGSVLELIDMEPCPDSDAAKCPVYRPKQAYFQAIEVPKGKSAALGLETGGSVRFTTHC